MPGETLLIPQIAAILGLVGVIFGAYRLLVSQKDATIQLLKEEIEVYKSRLEYERSQSPDVAAQALAARVTMLQDELSRMQSDAAAGAEAIGAKERELELAEDELSTLRDQISRAEQLFSGFCCPYCKSAMRSRVYHSQVVEHMGRGEDIDYEILQYECGLETINGDESEKCGGSTGAP